MQVTVRPDELIREYDEAVIAADHRSAMEYAYALTELYRWRADIPNAEKYAIKCLDHAESIPTETLEDVTTRRLNIGGIELPERLHDGVVRSRFVHLLPEQAES
ncbi:hypothetical protein [Actinocatenispora rupis]|uniref:Uncharacterized protein n=1 Tax=Actinocatenispora rupis TaxID=519421 RepID=A0A8J3IXH1_9ACTN|nr:hypothetical protein [Actinocatenispora rupis]GID11831.1 hypothetical protein Aru02nite_27200 [Actinocatenispora rupis]